MTTLYISGGMSGLPDHNFPAFFAAEDLLTAAGYQVLNPARQGIIKGWEWEDYLRHDLHEVLRADGVATLPGWRLSKGARLEVYVAQALKMDVRAVSTWSKRAAVAA